MHQRYSGTYVCQHALSVYEICDRKLLAVRDSAREPVDLRLRRRCRGRANSAVVDPLGDQLLRPGHVHPRVVDRGGIQVLPNDRSYRKCAGENAPGADRSSGRRTFDKTVSSKPLAFAADAAAMGIDCLSGTRVRVYGHREGSVIDLGGSQYAAAKLVDGRCQRKF